MAVSETLGNGCHQRLSLQNASPSTHSIDVDTARVVTTPPRRRNGGFPNMGSLGKQFKHIGRIQLGYTDALRTGRLIFWKPLGDPSLESEKNALLSFLEANDRQLFSVLRATTEEQLLYLRIDGTGKSHQSNNELSVYDLVDDLTMHEILHQGELVVYMKTLGLAFLESWKLWGTGFLRKLAT